MKARALASPFRDGSRLREFLSANPEWWTLALAAVAWISMLPHLFAPAGPHRHHHREGPGRALAGWLAMVAAMMMPSILYQIRMAALRSPAGRRLRAMIGFLAGYAAPWTLFGIAACWSAARFDWPGNLSAALLFAFSALWGASGIRSRAVAVCHREFYPAPGGWAAEYGCLRSGAMAGCACVIGCWPLMLGCLFSHHGLVAMAGGLAINVLDARSFRYSSVPMSAGAALMAVYYLVLSRF